MMNEVLQPLVLRERVLQDGYLAGRVTSCPKIRRAIRASDQLGITPLYQPILLES